MEPEGSLPHSQQPPPHLSLSCAISTQSTSPSFKINFNIILHLRLCLSSRLFPPFLQTKPRMNLPCLPHVLYPPSPPPQSHSFWFDIARITIFGEEYRSINSSLCSPLHSPVTSSLLGPNTFLTPYSRTLSTYVPPRMWKTKFCIHTKQKAELYFCTP